MEYLGHIFESIRSHTRDVRRVQCTRCRMVVSFSMRSRAPTLEKIVAKVKDECSGPAPEKTTD